LNFKQALLIP